MYCLVAIDANESSIPDLANFDIYERMSWQEKEDAIWATIYGIAKNETPPINNSNDNESGLAINKNVSIRFHICKYF